MRAADGCGVRRDVVGRRDPRDPFLAQPTPPRAVRAVGRNGLAEGVERALRPDRGRRGLARPGRRPRGRVGLPVGLARSRRPGHWRARGAALLAVLSSVGRRRCSRSGRRHGRSRQRLGDGASSILLHDVETAHQRSRRGRCAERRGLFSSARRGSRGVGRPRPAGRGSETGSWAEAVGQRRRIRLDRPVSLPGRHVRRGRLLARRARALPTCANRRRPKPQLGSISHNLRIAPPPSSQKSRPCHGSLRRSDPRCRHCRRGSMQPGGFPLDSGRAVDKSARGACEHFMPALCTALLAGRIARG